ncbi:MAG TPA: YihA family ribosome biogenesis GTP-binding protein, partial [Emticicia sp.]
RIEPQMVDLNFIDALGEKNIPFYLIFTKADKVGKVTAEQNIDLFKRTMLQTWSKVPPYFVTSSERRIGREELLKAIDELNQSFKK